MFQLLQDAGSYCLCLYAVLGVGAMAFVMRQLQKMLPQQLNRECSRTDNIPPGSLGFPFIGETIHFMAAINSKKGFYDFVRVRSLRYGNCFKTNIFGETHVFMRSTASAKTILNNELGRFTKRYIKSIAELVGNRSLLCASPHHHKMLRARLVNLFSSNSVSLLVKHFDPLIVDALNAWEDGGTVIVLDESLKITFKAMCKMLLSLESGAELESLQKDVSQVCKAMLAFPLRFPWTPFYKGLQAEAEQLAEKISKNSFLTLDDLNEMPCASKVVKESLRMASVVPWFPRLVLEDCEIEGYKIKKGWNVNIDARSIHLDPRVYSEPHKFNPWRWKVMDSDSSTEKWALFSRLRSGCPVKVTRIVNIE
ncbi:hypothetical protein V6N12_065200 [Hibiscus sabdariffa]|uniref:Cytochrome P450 n=1 Tax=Hibiscus sabdariffa TaxID=183260 RepID=A0ABR2G8Z0_9ROSI